MSIVFKKGANWMCKKCNAVFALIYDLDKTEEDVFKQLVENHKKKQPDCSAPSGFRQTDLFIKHEEVK
jgi:predicted transcriptional regulator